MSVHAAVATLAAISSLALAALALVGRPRSRLQWTFALGMVAFAVEAILAFMLLTVGGANGNATLWLTALSIAGLLLLLPWGVFIVTLADLQMPSLPRAWRIGLALGVAVCFTSAFATAMRPSFSTEPGRWSQTGATLFGPAWAAAIVQLVITVALLAGLEACLRSSRGDNRRRVKYLVLGLGGIFIIRFYLLSQVLLFHSVVPMHLKTMGATLFVGNMLLALPIGRAQLRGAQIRVSRQMMYRSAVVGVLGLYLFTVGLLGSLLTYLAVPEETFWGSVVVFVSALGLTALLLSDDLRWRLQRFIALHFYRSKYDYRQQWIAFTNRLTSAVTAGEIARELIDALAEVCGASTAAVYLSDGDDLRYRLHGKVGAHDFPAVIDNAAPLPAWLRSTPSPALLPVDIVESFRMPSAAAATAVALRWRQTLLGFMVLGPERSGREYTVEDFEFLATVAEQAATSIVRAHVSESTAQARELETFDRVTTTILHDIKNSVSALSMLSRNAVRHFDDPEFRRDTMLTVSRTAERLRRLVGKLSSPSLDALPLSKEPVDLSELIAEATAPLAVDGRVRLRRDIGQAVKVEADREALLRVIENLATNAVEAIDGEGTVAIRLSEENGSAVIEVRDSGRGISEDFLERHLFVPFRSTKKGGWGIGLYQTKQIVERHGGTIRVESIEGLGTTFTVSLPVTSERPVRSWETV